MAPRKKEVNQQIRDARKEQILLAALKVFAKRGFYGTKISDISSMAGLSHGLVYHYFASKDEIFTDLVKRALESRSRVVSLALEQPGTALDKINWLTRMILHGGGEESPYYFLIVLQSFTSDAVPDEVKEMIGALPPSMNEFDTLIREGQRAGLVIDGDPALLGALYFSLIQGLVIASVEGFGLTPEFDENLILRLLKK